VGASGGGGIALTTKKKKKKKGSQLSGKGAKECGTMGKGGGRGTFIERFFGKCFWPTVAAARERRHKSLQERESKRVEPGGMGSACGKKTP